jgi:hypothetical protein
VPNLDFEWRGARSVWGRCFGGVARRLERFQIGSWGGGGVCSSSAEAETRPRCGGTVHGRDSRWNCVRVKIRGYSALSVKKKAISVENHASGKRRQRREPDDRALSTGQVYVNTLNVEHFLS